MTPSLAFHPSVMSLESRWLPSASIYSIPVLNQLQDTFVAQAKQAANPVVFLGDSITYNWGTTARWGPGAQVFARDFAPLGAANFGIFGDTTADVIARVQAGDLAGKPKVAVVMIGVNDLIRGESPLQAAEGVVGVVQSIQAASPKTTTLLLGVLPSDNPILNPMAQALDHLISGMGNYPGVVYENAGAVLLGANGQAPANLFIDGLHPDLQGYELIANAIDGPIVKLLQEANYTANRPAPLQVSAPARSASVSIPTPHALTPASTGSNVGAYIPFPAAPIAPLDLIAAPTPSKAKPGASAVINESTR